MSQSQTAWTYACYGCVDIINDARTIAYHQNACANGLYSCDTEIQQIEECFCPTDGVPGDYNTPAIDAVCWYDPDIPESEEFLGVLVTNVEGDRDSTYKRQVTGSINRGSVIQREELSGRAFGIEVVLLATTCAGMEYGIEFVRRTFENATCSEPDVCERCTGRSLRVRLYCDAELDGDRGLRDWMTVATVDGLNIDENDSFNCCCWRRGVMTLHSEEPFSFSSKETVCELEADIADYNGCIGWDVFCADCASQLCEDCKDCAAPEEACVECRRVCGACNRCSYDPICTDNNPALVTPLFVRTDDCFCDPIEKIIQCCEVNDTRNNIDTTLRLSLFSGRHTTDTVFNTNGLRNARLRIWPNPQGLPPITDDASYGLWRRRAACVNLDISYIPPDATLIIDGRTESVVLDCDGECRRFDRVVSSTVGGPIFPLGLSCTAYMVCIEWDMFQTQFDATAPNLVSSLTVEQFLRWRS